MGMHFLVYAMQDDQLFILVYISKGLCMDFFTGIKIINWRFYGICWSSRGSISGISS